MLENSLNSPHPDRPYSTEARALIDRYDRLLAQVISPWANYYRDITRTLPVAPIAYLDPDGNPLQFDPAQSRANTPIESYQNLAGAMMRSSVTRYLAHHFNENLWTTHDGVYFTLPAPVDDCPQAYTADAFLEIESLRDELQKEGIVRFGAAGTTTTVTLPELINAGIPTAIRNTCHATALYGASTGTREARSVSHVDLHLLSPAQASIGIHRTPMSYQEVGEGCAPDGYDKAHSQARYVLSDRPTPICPADINVGAGSALVKACRVVAQDFKSTILGWWDGLTEAQKADVNPFERQFLDESQKIRHAHLARRASEHAARVAQLRTI